MKQVRHRSLPMPARSVPHQCILHNRREPSRWRSNAIARALADCEECIDAGHFEPALEAIDAALVSYPDDSSLIARRREVVTQRKALQTAARIRTVMEEAEWF